MSSTETTFVLRTGTANTASVVAALERAETTVRWVERAADILDAERLVLPGVGTPLAALARLEVDGLLAPLRERLAAGAPTLAICLGLQLLAEQSAESPGVRGLGLVRGRIEPFDPETVRVPQLGWNHVEADAEGLAWLAPGYAYFANSYCLPEAPGDDWQVAWAEHGRRFVAALARGGVVACQFHPELSGAWGQALIDRWLREGTLAADAAKGGR